MPNVTNGAFSNYCYDEMWELFKTPGDEVGSKFEGNRRGRSLTNCIIYVSHCLIYGHIKIGFSEESQRIEEIKQRGLIKQDGASLAKYLVNQVGWDAHYWNPDVDYKGNNGEHKVSYQQVLKTKHYLPHPMNLPIDGLIVDYNKREKTTKRVWVPTPVNVGAIVPVPIPVPTNVTNDNTAILEKFSQVKFAYGIAVGATHTFLLSYGEVFEVHWREEGAKLYGKTPLKDFPLYYSGVIMTPPDSTFTSDKIEAR